MAIYVTADLHGISVKEFEEFLQSTGFHNEDWLYVLGDVIDRNGDGGIGILRWLLEQSNVQLLRGNHEEMMLSCAWVFSEITASGIEKLYSYHLGLLDQWVANGGKVTMEAFKKLLMQDPQTAREILNYLIDAPLIETVEVGDRVFVLCHAGLGNFQKSKKLSEYTAHELLWNRPCATDRYFEKATTVFGHTPTWHYGAEGKAFYTDTWIDIDTGAAGGGKPMLLRLDDMAEFYME
ncbi:MAG: calcineurin [Clostridiales bacterium]|nr:calcineurin [Clostridiales bacterium]